MKKLTALLLALVMVFALAACGGTPAADSTPDAGSDATPAPTPTPVVEDEPMKVALCLTGAINDAGWNQVAYEGLLAIEEQYGAEITYTENLAVPDMVAAYTDYAADGYDLIIGHSFLFGDVALEVCDLYPDTHFAVIEGSVSNGTNVSSYVMSLEQSSYLMGMIAGGMTESNKVGMVGAMEMDSLIKGVNAFEDGVKAVNPDAEFSTAWTGSFVDTALAKEAAVAMIENGVDVIGHCANECGNGAIQAAQEAGIYAMGSSYDQSFMAPETIVVSDCSDVTVLMLAIAEDHASGNFTGEIREMGMAEGVVLLAPYHDFENIIPQELQDLVEETRQAIVDGSFVVVKDTTLR